MSSLPPRFVPVMALALAAPSLAFADTAGTAGRPHDRARFVTESPDTAAVDGRSCAVEIDPATDRPLIFFYTRAGHAAATSMRLEREGHAWRGVPLELVAAPEGDSTARVAATWLEDTAISEEIAARVRRARSSARVQDRRGLAHILFADADGVYYAREGVRAIERVDDSPVPEQQLCLRIDPHDTLHMAYHTDSALRYATRATDWHVETIDADALVVSCALALDAHDTPHIAYTVRDTAGDHLRYATRELHALEIEADSRTFARVRSGPGVTSVVAWARVGGTTGFAGPFALVDEDATGVYTGEIAVAPPGARGLEIYLVANDAEATLGSPDAPLRCALPTRLTAPTPSEPGIRLLAAPLDVSERADACGLLDAVYEGPSWRLIGWEPHAGTYREVTPGDPAAFEPGHAYWAILPALPPLTLAGTSAFPPRGREDFEVALRSGWNLVGNPAPYTVSLDPEELQVVTPALEKSFARAATDGQLHGTIFTFDAANVDSACYRFDRRVLAPWEGCWIKNESAATLTLRIPARALGEEEVAERERRAVPVALAWRLALTATTTDETTAVALAFAARGEEALDVLDVRLPPEPPGRALHMAIVHPIDLLADGAASLYRDVRAAETAEAEWTIRLTSDAGPVELSWDTPRRATTEPFVTVGSLALIDPHGNAWDMSETRTVSLPSGSHELRVVARPEPSEGTGPVVFDASIRPNPFRSETTFHYELPDAGAIRLGVFDISGRLVWSFSQESASAGGHAVYWDGMDARAQRVQPGTYFLRVARGTHAGAESTLTRKITVLP